VVYFENLFRLEVPPRANSRGWALRLTGAPVFESHLSEVQPKLTQILEAMDMALDSEVCPGLVPADEATLFAKMQADAPLEEIVALERAHHFKADYVYFRRLPGRPAMATVYIFDWMERQADVRQSRRGTDQASPGRLREVLAELQRELWSAGEVPLVYVFLPTQIQIFHVLQGPRADRERIEANPWQIIELAAETAEAMEKLKAFSARRLDDGRFWEEHPDARTLKLEGSAFMALSQEIADCRAELTSERHRVDEKLVRRLLILFILIKYIEERSVFPEGTFAAFADGAEGFPDLLRAGGPAVLAFLDHLAQRDRFNGDVFELDAEVRETLATTNLTPFADLLDARIDRGQRTLWRRYAFHELPVELISHLYEQFLPRQPGVVYTPPFLVSFILEQVLPLSQRTTEGFRLIDPACGSGVFLVGAFKRLVHRWRRDNGFRDPDVETLKRLLREHIFGVDLEGEAIRLTMFSLAVALCDFLQPRVIWDELHFDHLLHTQNLFVGDFFACVHRMSRQDEDRFDIIVGNPPFVSELTLAAEAHVNELKEAVPGFDLPDRQAALLFLESALRIARPSAQIALIQPSGPLLYGEGSGRFRRPFLEKVHVSQIVDLTHLSRVLFKRRGFRGMGRGARGTSANPGDVAVAVVFAENALPTDEPLLHVTIRRTAQAEQKLMFEIDHYDLHFIPRAVALSDPDVWKANFIGGGRIPHLVRRIRKLRSLGAFLEKATQERGWVKGEGYIVGNETKIRRLETLRAKDAAAGLTAEESREMEKLERIYREAPWLTGCTMLPTEAFTSEGLDEDKIATIAERFFEAPRTEQLFTGPLLLVKELIEAKTGKVPVALREEGICFKHRIWAVHAPRPEFADLKRVADLLADQKLVHFHILATSPEYLVNKSSAFRAADLLGLPFPESAEDLALSPLERALVDDALTHVADFKRKGDFALVRRAPRAEELKQFGEVFCQVLGSIYQSLQASEPVSLPGGICYPFYFGETPSDRFEAGRKGEVKLDKLLQANVSPSLRCQRILRVFTGNMLLLVKPAQLRYWLRSIAVRDADEVFAELQTRGY
jgi:hypothetical protein